MRERHESEIKTPFLRIKQDLLERLDQESQLREASNKSRKWYELNGIFEKRN